MSVRVPARPPSSSALAQERATSLSNTPADMPAIDSSIKMSIGKKKKVPRERKTTRTKPSEPADAIAPPRVRYRYEPYRKADPNQEQEGDYPADPEDLRKLDATAKAIYRSDREMLEYIEALNRRTAAVLEHVNRTSSQLRSCEGVMERIDLFVGQWQKTCDRPANQQVLGDNPLEVNNGAIVPGSGEEGDAPDPGLSPTAVHNEGGTLPTVLFRNSKYDYTRDILGGSAPQSPYNRTEEEDPYRPETPRARQPPPPPSRGYENDLDYPEGTLEMRSDFSAPPHHAAFASDDSIFNRSGVDLRITSDTGLLFPPSALELARISKEFKREAMYTAEALAIRSPTNLPRSRRPLVQSRAYIPPSAPVPILQSEPQHLVPPLPVLRTPPPSRIIPSRKRKRPSTLEDEGDNDAGDVASPSIKRRRLIVQQQSFGSRVFPETGCVPAAPGAGPTRENPPEPSSQPVRKQGPPPPIGPLQMQREDSEIEGSRVVETFSQVVGRGELEIEGDPTLTVLADIGEPDSTENPQSKVKTPTKSRTPGPPASVPEDVFGPIVFSARASKISDRLPAEVFQDVDRGVAISDPEHEIANISHKSTRFNLDSGTKKKEYKVFRKTPIRPRTLSWAIEAENALAAGVEKSWDGMKPLPSPKKTRAAGARTHKQKATPSFKPETAINSEDGFLSISANKPPSKLRRSKPATVQPQVPLSKAPVRKSTRSKKKN